MARVFTDDERAAWFNTLDRRVSSACVILEDDAGKALIVKATYKDHWTFPGGVIDAGETPKQAALRETHEEVGLVVDEAVLKFVGVASRVSHHAMTYQFIFKAPLSENDKANIVLQASEIAEHRFVSREEVALGEVHYGKVIENWAQGVAGYTEQTFGSVNE